MILSRISSTVHFLDLKTCMNTMLCMLSCLKVTSKSLAEKSWPPRDKYSFSYTVSSHIPQRPKQIFIMIDFHSRRCLSSNDTISAGEKWWAPPSYTRKSRAESIRTRVLLTRITSRLVKIFSADIVILNS